MRYYLISYTKKEERMTSSQTSHPNSAELLLALARALLDDEVIEVMIKKGDKL